MSSGLINTALDIGQAAGDLSGVPYLSSAFTLVKSIKDNCDRVQAHKSDCRQLSNKAAKLIETLREQASRLEDSQLREYADQIDLVLAKVNSRTNRWAGYNRLHAFWRDDKIAEGIKQCSNDLDTALSSFQVNAVVVLNHNQEEMKLMILNNSDNVEQILGILNNPEEVHRVADLQRTGAPVAERLMDAGKRRLQVLREQHGDSSRPVESEAYRQTERGMSELFTMTGIPPTLRNLNGEITRPDDLPYVGGVHSDVWIGYWLGDQKVALKTMRGVVIPQDKAQQRFEREIKIWSKLSHPHVLPFLGIVTDLGYFTHMVSPWQNNGNVLDYINKYQKADRVHLLSGAAEGLAYLHTEKVVHGNVRCANILVAIGGEAVICDFGMSKIREETSAQSATMTLTTQGSTRWMSPELLDALVTSPTAQCDIYSFGMTMLECFTLQPPFTEIKRDFHFISLMSKGPLTPKRPENEAATKWISEDVWKLMTDSWSRDPEKRPEMKEVVSRIHAIEMTARASAFSSSSTPTPTSTPPSVIQMPTPVVQS